jgi:hypothetical protein
MNIIFNKLVPTKTIIFAMDGIAPEAKVKVQIKRKNAMKKRNVTELQLSRGTTFMINFKKNIGNYIKFLEAVYGVKVYFDDTDKDEAEIKIGREITKLMKIDEGSCIVVSSDSDMIVILLMEAKYDNIYIYNMSSIISLSELVYEHVKKYGCSENPNYDLSVVSILLGNDYLPKIKFLTFNIWEYYKRTLLVYPRGLFINGSIDNKFFEEMISHIILTRRKVMKMDVNKNLCLNYFEGLNWCVQMYINGNCSNLNYKYDFNRRPAPFEIIIFSQYI